MSEYHEEYFILSEAAATQSSEAPTPPGQTQDPVPQAPTPESQPVNSGVVQASVEPALLESQQSDDNVVGILEDMPARLLRGIFLCIIIGIFLLITWKFPCNTKISPEKISNFQELTRNFWKNESSPRKIGTLQVITRKFPWDSEPSPEKICNLQEITRIIPWNNESSTGNIESFQGKTRKLPWNSGSSPGMIGYFQVTTRKFPWKVKFHLE